MCSCIKCGLEIKQEKATGRPKQYCSPACRRAAEYEIRRLDARLSGLENDMLAHRLGRMMDLRGDNEAKINAEITRAEQRLKELLGAGQGD